MVKKSFKDYELPILSALLIITTISLISIFIISSNSKAKYDDDIIDAYNILYKNSASKCNGLFSYDSKKIESKSLEPEIKMCISFYNIKDEDIDIKEFNHDSKNKDVCKKDNMIFKVSQEKDSCVINVINKEILYEAYTSVFGDTIDIDELSSTFNPDNYNVCFLKDDYYYCGLSEEFTFVIFSDFTTYKDIYRVEKSKDNLIIYDYFIKTDNNNCYKYYTTNIENLVCSKKYSAKGKINYSILKKYGTRYKHIYKKNDNGSYYWVSSEPIKK